MCVNLAHVLSLSVQLPYLFRQNMFTPSAAVDISGFLSSVILLGYDSLLQFPLNSLGVIVTLGSGSLAINLFFLQTITLKCSSETLRLNVLAPELNGDSGFYSFHAYATQRPQSWRLWHEVEWVDIVVTSLMSHSPPERL